MAKITVACLVYDKNRKNDAKSSLQKTADDTAMPNACHILKDRGIELKLV